MDLPDFRGLLEELFDATYWEICDADLESRIKAALGRTGQYEGPHRLFLKIQQSTNPQ